MTTLLDGNVLVALCTPDHVHHDVAASWWGQYDDDFATTPITQGTALRFLLRAGLTTVDAMTVVDAVTGHPRHAFWADDRPYTAALLRGVVGHRQVTDAYLAALAVAHGGRVATLDRGLAARHPDVAELIPT